MLLIFGIGFILLNQQAASQIQSSGKIEIFTAEDVPSDDGSGIMLSWHPLPKEMRIISYKIYRGISPDTLFLLGQIEVDANVGVAAEKMYFYDKDYPLLLSIDSPNKLKKEKQQGAGSPIYAGVPRDPVILERLFPHFSMLGVIDNPNYYKHAKKIINPDGTVSAGLKVNQFEQIVANPLPGKTYYYTVLAVDEKGIYLPHADIRKATPHDNPPDTSSKLNSLYIEDLEQFNFEWTASYYSLDIAQWQIWMLSKAEIAAFEKWQSEYIAQDAPPAPWTAKAILLAEKPNDYQNFLSVPLKNKRLINQDGTPGVLIPVDNLQNYLFILATTDYSGFHSYASGNPIKTGKSDILPRKTVFSVADKPDDKGDTNVLSFGLPFVYITRASFANQKKDKLNFNFELASNLNYKITRIRFDFFTGDDEKLGSVTEYFPDKIINLKLKKPMPDLKHFTAKINLTLDKNGSQDFYIIQEVRYDPQTRNFAGGDIIYNQENFSRFSYLIMRKSSVDPSFFPVKKIATISRSYDDVIAYEAMLQKLIQGVDTKSGRVLLSPDFTLALATETGMPLTVSIYRDEQEKAVRKLKEELAKLKSTPKGTPAQNDSLQAYITMQEARLNALLNNKAYQKAQKTGSQSRWLRILRREQQTNARSYAYQVLKTDNEAAFILSDESTPFKPIANWFDKPKWVSLVASVLFTFILLYSSFLARRRTDLYIRPIAGLLEIDNAVGRATEMGRPILYVPGLGTIGEVCTIASLMILNRVAKKAAEYDSRLLVPNCDYFVMPLAQEMVRDAFYEAGRPDAFDSNDTYFVASDQFPFVAGVNGAMVREKTATNFYMGSFYAEALLMTETGNATVAIQIAGTDSITQVPFFITTCDYTLIGEEFYAASAYLSKNVELIGMLKAQDYFKFLIVFFVLLGTILSTIHWNALVNSFPIE